MPARGPDLKRAPAHGDAGSLPLQLPEPPAFPSNLRPEEAVPCMDAFDRAEWRFSVDWDGVRALLFAAGDGSVRLVASGGVDVTDRVPELAACGATVLRRPAVLDGVVALLEPGGRPDLAGLSLRMLAGAPAAGTAPAVFLATDVLQAGGIATAAWPLDRRLSTLARLVDSGTSVQVPEHITGRGTALAEAARARGLTALLARNGAAPYRPGVASPDRLRVPLVMQGNCVVAGLEPGRLSGAGRLILAEYEGGRLVYAGRVDGPRDHRLDAWLSGQARALQSSDAHLGVHDARMRTTWLTPSICATVRYAARDSHGVLQQTSLVALRDDLDPAWCVRREPVAPPAWQRAGGFVPTVLMPLPLDDALVPRLRG